MNGQSNTFYFGNAATLNIKTGEKIAVPATVESPYYMLYSASMDTIRNTLTGRKVRNAQFFVCGSYSDRRDTISIASLQAPYDARTVNGANVPKLSGSRPLNQEGTAETGIKWASTVIENILDPKRETDREVYRAFLENGIRVGANYVKHYTSVSEYRPYVVLYSDDITFNTTEEYPKDNSYINPRAVAEFGWGIEQETGPAILGNVVQKSAEIHWRIKGQTAENTIAIANASASKSNVAANTFTAAKLIEWCIRVTDANGVMSPWSDWFTISTTDALSSPRTSYPKNLPIDASKQITFSWVHEVSSGTAQTKYELQYSTDGGKTWVSLATESASRQTYTTAAGKFAAGQVTWRVRTYNSDGAAGAWSEAASFIARAAPTCAIAGCDNKPRPTIRWQSSGQQGYEVKITDKNGTVLYESEMQYGTVKEYKCPVYLNNGAVTVSVRVQNTYGMYSGWATTAITIANIAQPGPLLKTRPVQYGAELAWEASGFARYIVYRNENPIASTTGKVYTDFRAAGVSAYQIRGITTSDYYGDSMAQRERTAIRHAAIARIGVWDWLPLIFRQGENPSHTENTDINITYTHYSGRKLPVAESDGAVTRTHSFDYSLETQAEVERLRAMEGRFVAYKNAAGEYAEGILALPAVTKSYLRNVSFTITEVSGEEYDNGT